MKFRRVPRHARPLAVVLSIVLVVFTPVVRAEALDEWSFRNQVPTSHGVRSIAEGDGVLVAVADGPTFLRSTSGGESWESIPGTLPQGITSRLLDIAYGNQLFVAVGSAAQVYTSPDGLIWTPRSVGSSGSEFRSVVFANNIFVIAGTDSLQNASVLLSSPDGLDWTPRDGGVSGPYRELVFENNEFIACGGNMANAGFVTTSANGTTWTPLTTTLPNPPFSVTYGLGSYHTITPGTPSIVYSSSDGTTWTGGPNNSLFYYGQIRAFDGKLVSSDLNAFNPNSNIRVSTDGTTWTPSGFPSMIHRLKVIDDVLYALHGHPQFNRASPVGVSRTTDAANWQPLWDTEPLQGFESYGELESILCAGGGFYTSGDLGGLARSSNGVSWRNGDVDSFPRVYDFARHEGTIVAVGEQSGGDSVIATSADNGISWTQQTLGDLGSFEGVAFGNGVYVAVGEKSFSTTNSVIASSPDGLEWTVRDSGTPREFLDVTFGNGLFVAVNGSRDVVTSPDGETWTVNVDASSNNMNAVFFADGVFVGGFTDMFTSTDGINWTKTDSVVGGVNGIAYGAGT